MGVTSSGSRYYVVKSGKGMTTYMTIRNSRRSINKKNARTANTVIVIQYFMKLLEEFKDFPYLGYSKRQV